MLGVAALVGQQAVDQPFALVWESIPEELVELLHTGQYAEHVQIDATRIQPILDRSARPDVSLCEVRGKEPINRVGPSGAFGRKLRLPGMEVERSWLGEGDAF